MSFFILFLAGAALFHLFQYFPFTSIFIFASLCLSLVFRKRYLWIIFAVIGICYAFIRYAPETDLANVYGKKLEVSGIFSSEAVETSSGKFSQPFKIHSAIEKGAAEPLKELREKNIYIISDNKYKTGKFFELEIKLIDIKRLNPGSFKSNQLYATLYEAKEDDEAKPSLNAIQNFWQVFNDLRIRLNEKITDTLNPEASALVSAITTGERRYISEELRDAFNSSGLAHILSISGTHFGLFSIFLFGGFRFLIKYLPYKILQRVTIYVMPSQGAAILTLPFILAYLGLSGSSIPAVRSFIMIGLFLIGLLIERKEFWLNSLLFAAVLIVGWSPDALFSLSFQLSFIAVLFIGFFISQKEKSEKPENRFVNILKNTALITLAASLGTAPLVAYHFNYFSIISPLANFLIAPFIGFVILPLSLFSAFVFIFTGHYLFSGVINAAASAAIYLVKFMAGVPFADIKMHAFPVIFLILFYAGFAIFLLFERKRYLLLVPVSVLVAGIIYLAIPKGSEMAVTYLDVGQGDSSVIQLPDKKILVIDTGRSGREVAGFLRYLGRRKIDALILSHGHPDHAGGADYLIKHFKVKEIWDNGRFMYPEGMLTGVNHRSLERGDIIEGNKFVMHVLHPYKEFYTMSGDEYTEDNNSSLVLRIEGGKRSFLFAGDIEEEAEEDIAHLFKWLKSDVIKIPHHGARASASEGFLDAVSPQIAVISAGRNNSFGHPHEEMLEYLKSAKVYRTDLHGAIKISEHNGLLEVKTFKDSQFAEARDIKSELKNIKRLFAVW